MSYKLLIVESPAKAKTIEKYLKDLGNFKVVASIGHVRDLPKSNKNAIDIEGGFIPNYEISKGKEATIHSIQNLAEKAEEIYLATDPDREGEAISWHIKEVLIDPKSKKKVSAKKFKRVTFHEITEEAVREAVQHPRDIDDNLKQAQEARRVLDRLVGYDLSGLIWKKVRYGLSAGRVQSPALRIIMEREREIRAFKAETFWVISADLAKSHITFTAVCVDEPRDKKEVDRILEVGKDGEWHVTDVKETQAKRSPYAPFITSTLQQTASTRLGFAPARTMSIAQRLYESGSITYMRTDSTTLSKQALGQIASIIKKEYGDDFLEMRTYAKKSKNAQEAHEAIRPTHFASKTSGHTEDERKLYNLIWSRTVASQMIDAQVLRTRILSCTKGEKIPEFAVNGQRVIKEGWLKADPHARGEDTEVPKVAKGDLLDLKKIYDEEKETQPPSRYTEAGLIKELEKRGIGRPSTYASIIKTIVDRGYVEKLNRTLMPTDTGDVVSTFLEANFMDYISDSFTAEMENELDDIANGDREYVKTLKDFYTPFSKDVASKEDIPKLTTLGDADPKLKCPKCGASLQIKLGKTGKFLSCSKYPECDGALMINGKEMGGETPLGMHPESGEPIFVLNGRFGPYVQIGKKTKENKKPQASSIPKEIDPEKITLEEAVHLLILPRQLGAHPEIGKPVFANIGKFGPYVGCDGDFRSLKEDSPYEVSLEKALELLAQPKQPPRGAEIVRVLGKHPRTKKEVVLYKSKSGLFLKRGLRRIYLPNSTDGAKLSVEEAIEMLKG